MRAEPYCQENLQTALEKLRALAIDPMESRHVPRIMEAAGVRFLVVEHLPKTKIDGCALWLDERSPVVALSLRYDRIDWFWHTLAHEIGHILNHDAMSIDVNLPDETSEDRLTRAEQERRADEFASTFLVPQEEIEDFIRRVRPLYSKRKIVGFAGKLRVHPGIVVGQLQYRGVISYSHSRNMLSKVRDVIVQSALTDGWGSEISV